MPGTWKYQKVWEKHYLWVFSMRIDPQSAYCGICLKSFKINNNGIGQVKSHSKCHESGKRKETALNWKNRWVILSGDRGDIVLYGAAIIDCCKNQRFPFVDCNFLSSNTANTIISLAWKLIQKHCTKNAVSCGFGHIYWRNA